MQPAVCELRTDGIDPIAAMTREIGKRHLAAMPGRVFGHGLGEGSAVKGFAVGVGNFPQCCGVIGKSYGLADTGGTAPDPAALSP